MRLGLDMITQLCTIAVLNEQVLYSYLGRLFQRLMFQHGILGALKVGIDQDILDDPAEDDEHEASPVYQEVLGRIVSPG